MHFAANTFYVNMHEIYESICELKCESSFDWSTFPLTAIIFDWLWPKGCIVNMKFSLPDHKAVVHLKKKIANAWGSPGVCQRKAGRVGKDILTSAILCDKHVHLHEVNN